MADQPENLRLRDRRSIAVQISVALRELISREMRAGDQLPSEQELVEEFAASRASVREALKILERDGFLDVQHGRGRFVSATPIGWVNRPITRFESLTEMLDALGYTFTRRVVSAEEVSPSEEEAAALRVPPERTVLRLVRLYENEGRPLIISINAFDAALLHGEPVDEHGFEGSLHSWLAQRGHRPLSSVAQIRAERLPADVAAIDPADAEQPWISISERCVDVSGSFILFARDFHRGDLFTFNVLRRRDP